MSKNEGSEKHSQRRRKPDERIRRTHERLGMALLALMQEKPMEQVTVQEVLDRASVGRSTFYLHFRDKDDLLVSQFEQFLQFMSTMLSARKEESRRVVPVTEMFSHLSEQRKLYRALGQAGYLQDFYELARDYFARGIEQRLGECRTGVHVGKDELSARGVALAGSLLSLLRWWMDRGAKEPAAEMDRLFHEMVWHGWT